MTTETFGQMLAARRANVDMSRVVLSEIVDCHDTYIGLLERDARTPSRQTVLALADALALNTSQTDRLLYIAGHAPQVDYQMLYEAEYGAVDDQTKWCSGCQSDIPLWPTGRFYVDRSRHDGLDYICTSCRSRVNKAKYNARVAS
jgi:allantoicase